MRHHLFEWKEGLLISLAAIRANKARSLLTMLGIVIGICSVALMATAINGIDKAFVNGISVARRRQPLHRQVRLVQRRGLLPDAQPQERDPGPVRALRKAGQAAAGRGADHPDRAQGALRRQLRRRDADDRDHRRLRAHHQLQFRPRPVLLAAGEQRRPQRGRAGQRGRRPPVRKAGPAGPGGQDRRHPLPRRRRAGKAGQQPAGQLQPRQPGLHAHRHGLQVFPPRPRHRDHRRARARDRDDRRPPRKRPSA